VLIDGTGGPPVSNSVLLISGAKIAVAGPRTNVVIPQGIEEIDGSGKYIIPEPIDITAASHKSIVFLDGLAPAAADAAIEERRKASIPVFVRVSKLADAERLVAAGAAGFVGMITDTEQISPSFLAKMRDLRVIWAPALARQQGAALDVAKRNTGRLAAAQVLIAVAGNPEREVQLLVEAGLSPGDAIVAATRNGAMALRLSDSGTLQAGKRANLLMLPQNPAEDIRNIKTPGREMREGAWLK
jgi:imidazolonepropionase-like amidohydrolase